MDEKQEATHRFVYTKPKVLDLGEVTTVIGGSCTPVGNGFLTTCDPQGISPVEGCSPGSGYET